jgi:hypothetical protein
VVKELTHRSNVPGAAHNDGGVAATAQAFVETASISCMALDRHVSGGCDGCHLSSDGDLAREQSEVS